LLGNFYLEKQNAVDAKEAIQHLDKAIELDPEYAEAYASLSEAWDQVAGPEAIAPRRDAAQKALDLDANLAEAHVAEAGVKRWDWDWAGTDQEYRRALALNPDSDSCGCYAIFLAALGHFSEALPIIEHGIKVNPLSDLVQYNYGTLLFLSRRYREAETRLQRTIELEPHNRVAHRLLSRVYEMTGRAGMAVELSDSLESDLSSDLGLAYAFAGRRAEAIKVAQGLALAGPHPEARRIAAIYFALGENDQAFRWLTRAFDERDPLLINLRIDPLYDDVRSDPRYLALLARLKLPD